MPFQQHEQTGLVWFTADVLNEKIFPAKESSFLFILIEIIITQMFMVSNR